MKSPLVMCQRLTSGSPAEFGSDNTPDASKVNAASRPQTQLRLTGYIGCATLIPIKGWVMSQTRTAVITGASTGIGYASTQFLTKRGWHVFAGVRKTSDGKRLRDDFGDKVTALTMDVTMPETLQLASEAVAKALKGRTLNGLVNNAGIAVPGPLLHLPPEELNRQLDINVTGQLRAFQAFAPMLGVSPDFEGEPGRVVNMSSVAGISAGPFVGAYAASKHALEALTQGMRRELMLYGIDVVAINPGPIATPIWDKAEEVDLEPYEGTDYAGIMSGIAEYMVKRGRSGLPAVKVARLVHKALTASNTAVNKVITPEPFTQWLMTHLPARTVDRMIAKRIGLTPDNLALWRSEKGQSE